MSRHWSQSNASRRPALTLIELLIVITIIAVLISIMLPAMVGMRGTARTLVCSSDMKSISMDFMLFATGEVDRGDSSRMGNRFYIDDFQDRLYRLQEFWDYGSAASAPVVKADDRESELILCPSASTGPTDLLKKSESPCDNLPFSPIANLSIAFNQRLYQAVWEVAGQKVLAHDDRTTLSTNVLEHPYAPLVMDVNAPAVPHERLPTYIAPAGSDEDGPYSDDKFWYPSDRHNGRTNVAFIGGHVLRSEKPGQENWDWDYQGEID